MKKLLTYLLTGILFSSIQTATAGDRAGNGGSGDESKLAAQQAVLETTAIKIKNFFNKNKKSLHTTFSEINIEELVSKIEETKIHVVEREDLIDKNGINRTCLNFPESNLIECKSSEIDSLSSNPKALFVMVLHEILGLMQAEETSPRNINVTDGYSISKRIASYVLKVNDYDLVINEKCKISFSSVTKLNFNQLERLNSILIAKGFVPTSPSESRLDLVYSTKLNDIRFGANNLALPIPFYPVSISVKLLDRKYSSRLKIATPLFFQQIPNAYSEFELRPGYTHLIQKETERLEKLQLEIFESIPNCSELQVL